VSDAGQLTQDTPTCARSGHYPIRIGATEPNSQAFAGICFGVPPRSRLPLSSNADGRKHLESYLYRIRNGQAQECRTVFLGLEFCQKDSVCQADFSVVVARASVHPA